MFDQFLGWLVVVVPVALGLILILVPDKRDDPTSGVSSKAANWGQIKTGQRKWPGTVRSCT